MSNQSNEHASDGNRSLIEIDLENTSDGSEYANVESYLRNLHGIEAVHLDRTRGVAHLTYDSLVITFEGIEADLHGCGYKCNYEDQEASEFLEA